MFRKAVCVLLGVMLVGDVFSKDMDCVEGLPDYIVVSEPEWILQLSEIDVISKYGKLLAYDQSLTLEILATTSAIGTEDYNLAKSEKWLKQAKLHAMHAGALEGSVTVFPLGESYMNQGANFEGNKLIFKVKNAEGQYLERVCDLGL
jgi:hypothetical protein